MSSLIFGRVCQQALLNRLEPIFEPIFDDAQLRISTRAIDQGRHAQAVEKDSKRAGVDRGRRSVDHEKLLTLIAGRVADGRMLRLIRAMLKAGRHGKGQLFPTERGTPQGGGHFTTAQ
jgi:retron-type reverse transcriptase